MKTLDMVFWEIENYPVASNLWISDIEESKMYKSSPYLLLIMNCFSMSDIFQRLDREFWNTFVYAGYPDNWLISGKPLATVEYFNTNHNLYQTIKYIWHKRIRLQIIYIILMWNLYIFRCFRSPYIEDGLILKFANGKCVFIDSDRRQVRM